MRAGNFHSEALHVIERDTLTDPDHIVYEVTIEDPKVFTPAMEDQHAALPAHGKGASCLNTPALHDRCA